MARAEERAVVGFSGDAGVGRELAWHAYYLQAGSWYSEYFDARFVDQGSAYSYMQGASGAPRDFALFVLPLVYLRPDLAKDMLRFMLRTQRAKDGAFQYAVFGHGVASGGGVHSWSSDLDLFVLWALGEYVGATGDTAFLDEELAYYPKESGARGTVLDHARRSFAHLRDRVGLGRHGLIRAGTGDWNDVLLAFSRLPPATALWGESALNAGLATVALPGMADAVADADPALAAEMRAFAAGQARALEALWTGDWLARGYLGYGDAVLGADRIFLDAQAFPVMGGVWDADRARTLYAAIDERCATPQRAGARCLWPPKRGPLLHPGSDTNGGTWAAIDLWTAWGWGLVDPARAWAFYKSTLLAARAAAYPDVWYGVWSGPDSYNAHYHAKPGETFDFNATPMAKYPVFNMNRHAGPLLAAIKLAGLGPRDGGFEFAPRLPLAKFSLETPLAGIWRDGAALGGHVCRAAGSRIRIAIVPPPDLAGTARWRVTACGGAPVELDADALRIEAVADAAGRVAWRAEGLA